MQSDRDANPATVNDATLSTAGSPSVRIGQPSQPRGGGQAASTMGFVFLTGIIVLVIVVSLRFIRRAADPDLHGYGRRKPTRGFERGRGRDPWSEAGRRMVIPPLPIAGDGHIPIDGGDRRDGPADDGRHGHPGDDGSDGEGGSDDGGGADGGGSDGGGGGDGGGGDGGGGSD